MNIKSILLGTAAGLMVASAAQAADLPSEPTPAAVDYVKVCDAFGAGFFYIPGGETCLKFDGRVRSGVAFDEDGATWFANARVGFDTRTATELGTLRTYFRIKTGGEYNRGNGVSPTDSGIVVDRAFISIGYLTAGYAANFFDSFGSIYGDNDRNDGSEDRLQFSILADNFGGGFYAGIQALSQVDGLANDYNGKDNGGDGYFSFPDVQAIIGVKDQPWGSVALGAWYSADDNGSGDGFWAVKLGGEIKATDQLSIAARGYYQDFENAGEYWTVGAGVSYAATDALTVNANVAYYDDVADDNGFGATLGVDYTVVKGLVATAEVSYDDGYNGFDNDWAGLLRLSRSW